MSVATTTGGILFSIFNKPACLGILCWRTIVNHITGKVITANYTVSFCNNSCMLVINTIALVIYPNDETSATELSLHTTDFVKNTCVIMLTFLELDRVCAGACPHPVLFIQSSLRIQRILILKKRRNAHKSIIRVCTFVWHQVCWFPEDLGFESRLLNVWLQCVVSIHASELG